MKNIELEELKELQMDVLQKAHDFCEENNLKYSLACGTLLGAIRHNGYIPWDDDIDIYMPREDYKIFIDKFPKIYRNYYEIVSIERDKTWHRAYAKMYDNRTVWYEQKSSNEIQIGVGIDVFPVDYVPDDESEWQKYNKKRLFLMYVLIAKLTALRSKQRPLYKNIGIAILKIVLLPIPSHFLARKINTYIQKYDEQKTSRMFETSSGFRQKSPFSCSDFDTTEYHVFEDRQFKIMSGYDDCLTKGFGNYMELPPKEDQIFHHYYTAYWK